MVKFMNLSESMEQISQVKLIRQYKPGKSTCDVSTRSALDVIIFSLQITRATVNTQLGSPELHYPLVLLLLLGC